VEQGLKEHHGVVMFRHGSTPSSFSLTFPSKSFAFQHKIGLCRSAETFTLFVTLTISQV
jgi:hypothetical protein